MMLLKKLIYKHLFKGINIAAIAIAMIIPSLNAYSQTSNERKIDSLDIVLQNSYSNNASDKEICSLLSKLYNLSSISQPYLALEYAGQALQIATASNDKPSMALWQEKIADIYFDQKVYYMAMQNYLDAYTLYRELDSKREIAYALLNIGRTYFIQNVEDVAMSYYMQSDSIFTQINDRAGQARAKNNIGTVNLAMYQYEQAEINFDEALKISLETKEPQLIAETYKFLALLYDRNEEYEEEEKMLEQAVARFRIAGNKKEIANAYFALGEMHFHKQNYQTAYNNYQKAYNLYEELSMYHDIAAVFTRQGRINYLQEKYYVAQQMAQTSLSMSEMNGWLSTKAESLLLLSDVNNKLGKTDSAYTLLYRYTQVQDSVFEARKAESFSELQVSISTKETEKELAIAEAKLSRNKLIITIFVIIGVIGVGFMAFIIYNSRKTNKINQKLTSQNEEINHQKAEIERQNIDIKSSINYAARIQNAMLPGTEFLKRHFSDGFVYFHPREAVSGDFYWFSEVKIERPPSLFRRKDADIDDDSKILLAVIDCTGHGVPGAFMSMLGDALLNQIVNFQKITQPDIILNELNKLVIATLQQDTSQNNDGMDAAICTIDKNTRTLQFAGAKSPLLYVQDNEVHKVNGDLKAIGGIQKGDQKNFTCHTIDISKPTTLYIYSDGYQDQFGGTEGRKFMAKRFREMLTNNANLPFEEQNKILLSTFNEWKNSYIQMDDTTVIGVKI
ncbi:MAG: tetratricopeptide repeat protein [Bacteroidales bacterium]|nr:tetratricopeptide repeat protein [Bacteroidales bacterium]